MGMELVTFKLSILIFVKENFPYNCISPRRRHHLGSWCLWDVSGLAGGRGSWRDMLGIVRHFGARWSLDDLLGIVACGGTYWNCGLVEHNGNCWGLKDMVGLAMDCRTL